jgi:hypothetical protein
MDTNCEHWDDTAHYLCTQLSISVEYFFRESTYMWMSAIKKNLTPFLYFLMATARQIYGSLHLQS